MLARERVMRRRIVTVLLAAGLSAAFVVVFGVGCGEDEPADPDTNGDGDDGERTHGLTEAEAARVVATVGDVEITVGDVARELASKGSFIRTRYQSPERRREFLDQMIRFELLAQEAERRGYNDLPEVERTRKQMMIRRFIAERFESGGPDSITADDVREYYEAHRSEFHTPAQVRASHIRCRDRATAQRVLRELLADPSNLRLYRRLAEQHNTDPTTQDRFGDLRFFSRPDERTDNEPDIPAPIATAAFSIERIGGIYPEVVRTDQGWHIVKLTGRRAAMHRSLAEAQTPIRNRLWRERREANIQALIDELRAESDVEENLDLLDQVHLDLPDGDSPTVTNPALQGGQGGPSGALRVPPRRPTPPASNDETSTP